MTIFSLPAQAKEGRLSIRKTHPINTATFVSLKLACEYFLKNDCDTILLEIDSYGGEAFAAQKICNYIEKLQREENIAFVSIVEKRALGVSFEIAKACQAFFAQEKAKLPKEAAFYPVVYLNAETLQSIQTQPALSYSNWKMEFYAFLTNPIVLFLLFLGVFVGVYLEVSTNTYAIFGLMSLLCLGLIIFANAIAHAIGPLEFILLLVGAALLGCEILWIPGYGIIGVMGISLCLLSGFMMLVPGIEGIELFQKKSWQIFSNEIFTYFFSYLLTVTFAFVSIIGMAKTFAKTIFKKQLAYLRRRLSK